MWPYTMHIRPVGPFLIKRHTSYGCTYYDSFAPERNSTGHHLRSLLKPCFLVRSESSLHLENKLWTSVVVSRKRKKHNKRKKRRAHEFYRANYLKKNCLGLNPQSPLRKSFNWLVRSVQSLAPKQFNCKTLRNSIPYEIIPKSFFFCLFTNRPLFG